MHPHLEAFRTGHVLVPGVDIVLELFCNCPSSFCFGTNTSGVGVKRQVTLSQGELKVTLHLCRFSLNSSVYNALQAKARPMPFLETLLNYNRDEGETLLAPQGWVNYLNMREHLTAGGATDDICMTNGWGHGDSTPLKTATLPFYNNNKATLIMHPHLEAFHAGCVLVPGVEIVLELFCNCPSSFCLERIPVVWVSNVK